MKRHTSPLLAAIAGLAITTASAGAANVIVNGDFETGNLTGWDVTGPTFSTVTTTSPLAGTYSLQQTPGTGGVIQTFTPFTTAATASLIFNATDPGGAGDRSMNLYFGQGGTSNNRINLRLVDLDADGDGDIQVFDGAWNTVLTDAVTFGSTTTLSVTFNDYGASASYDLDVGGNTATNLSFFQNGAPTDFGTVGAITSSLASGSSVKIDNVSVIPEPSSVALLGLAGLALLRRRR